LVINIAVEGLLARIVPWARPGFRSLHRHGEVRQGFFFMLVRFLIEPSTALMKVSRRSAVLGGDRAGMVVTSEGFTKDPSQSSRTEFRPFGETII